MTTLFRLGDPCHHGYNNEHMVYAGLWSCFKNIGNTMVCVSYRVISSLYYMFLTRLHIGSWRGWIWGYRQDTCQASDHSSRLCFNICTLGIAGNSHCLGTSFGTFEETKAKQTLSIFHWVIEIQKSMFYLKHGFICLTLCAVNCCFRRVNIIGNFQLSLSIPTTGGLKAKTVILRSRVCWLRDTATSNRAVSFPQPIWYVKPWSLLLLSAEWCLKSANTIDNLWNQRRI